MAIPRVSVVMTVYNGRRYLCEAVDSILSQTFRDLEFIIVDDCSTDDTWDILRSYTDPRIRLVRNRENIGLTRSLNKGIVLAQGQYVARMDADDISEPQRLERQVDFLERNRDIRILGSNVACIGEYGQSFLGNSSYPTHPELIRWLIPFRNCFAHPTVIFHKQAIEALGGYNERFEFAQDYELWLRAIPELKAANLTEVLLQYRVHNESISQRSSDLQTALGVRAVQRHLARVYSLEVSRDVVRVLAKPRSPYSSTVVREAATVTLRLYQQWNNDSASASIGRKVRCLVTSDVTHRLLLLAISSRHDSITVRWLACRSLGVSRVATLASMTSIGYDAIRQKLKKTTVAKRARQGGQ